MSKSSFPAGRSIAITTGSASARCGCRTARSSRPTIISAKSIYPDIVVHQRAIPNNLLAIEVRKATNHQPLEHDQHKLRGADRSASLVRLLDRRAADAGQERGDVLGGLCRRRGRPEVVGLVRRKAAGNRSRRSRHVKQGPARKQDLAAVRGRGPCGRASDTIFMKPLSTRRRPACRLRWSFGASAKHEAVVPRACGVSSTPRLLDSIAGVSGILDHPHARVMTTWRVVDIDAQRAQFRLLAA